MRILCVFFISVAFSFIKAQAEVYLFPYEQKHNKVESAKSYIDLQSNAESILEVKSEASEIPAKVKWKNIILNKGISLKFNLKYTLKAIKQGKEINTGEPLTKTLYLKAKGGKNLEISLEDKPVIFPQGVNERTYCFLLEDEYKKFNLRLNIRKNSNGLELVFSSFNEQYKYLNAWRKGPVSRYFTHIENSKVMPYHDNICGTIKTLSVSDSTEAIKKPIYLFHLNTQLEKEIIFNPSQQKNGKLNIIAEQISSSSLELNGEKYCMNPIVHISTNYSLDSQKFFSSHCIKLFSTPPHGIYFVSSDAYELMKKNNNLHILDKLRQKLPADFHVPFYLENNKKEHRHGATIESFNDYSLIFKETHDEKKKVIKFSCDSIGMRINGKLKLIEIEPFSLNFNYIIIN
jgi:hypothetical protein